MKIPAPDNAFALLACLALPLAILHGAEPTAPAPVATATPAATAATAPTLGVQKSVFDHTRDGTEIDLYTLTNAKGATAKIITFGAAMIELDMPDRTGKFSSVIHGGTSLAFYQQQYPDAAAVIGRVANRIAGARFTLDDKDYQLRANNGRNTLHGGRVGFNKVVWKAAMIDPKNGASITLTYVSKDGEEGFPGTLTTSVTYRLTDQNTLRLDYTATTDQPTPVNLTNHAFFNLAGAGDTSAHVLTIFAHRYTPFDAEQIPTGEIADVKGTPFDFTQPTPLGSRADQLGDGRNYDNNWALDPVKRAPGELALAARVSEATSGRTMEVWTTEPGLQVYTSALSGQAGGDTEGFVCFETQHFPDSVHHDNFPSIILRPGTTFKSATEYRFTTAK